MDSFPLRIVPPRGDDEFASVHSAGLGVYALDEVTRIAHLLGRRDELRRDAVESGAAALEAGTIDVGTLLAYFGDRLRAGDAQLSLLVDELERQRRSCTIQEEVRQ